MAVARSRWGMAGFAWREYVLPVPVPPPSELDTNTFGGGTFGGGTFGDAAAGPPPPPPPPPPGLTVWQDRFGFGKWASKVAPYVEPPSGIAFAQTVYCSIGQIGSSGETTITRFGEPQPGIPTVIAIPTAPVIYGLSRELVPLVVIDSYQSFTWQDNWRASDEFTLVMALRASGGATLMDACEYICVPRSTGGVWFGVIEHKSPYFSADAETLVVSGRDYSSKLDGLLALAGTDEGDGYDTWTPDSYRLVGTVKQYGATAAMAHYVEVNGITGTVADASRAIPYLQIGTVQACGCDVHYQARFQYLSELLNDICTLTGHGYTTTFDPATNRITFDALTGVDRTETVIFSTCLCNVSTVEFTESVRAGRTIAYVASGGDGAARKVIPVWDHDKWGGTPPSGGDVKELFVDARDIPPEDTVGLELRGLQKLREVEPEISYKVDVIEGGMYRYPQDFDVGDMVTVNYSAITCGMQEIRITSVTETWDEKGRTITVAFGKEPRDVGVIIERQARRLGTISRN